MPESVTDRCTKAHEYIFLLAKSERYYYDADAIREDRTSDEDAREFRGGCYVGGNIDNSDGGKRKIVGNKRIKIPGGWDRGLGAHGTIHREGRTEAEYQEAETKPGRNKRSVWTVATQGFPEAHFATFPPALIEPCILAGCPAQCCAKCGAPLERHTEVIGRREVEHYTGQALKDYEAAGAQNPSDTKRRILASMSEIRESRFLPSCGCSGSSAPGVILDPFGGAGTTGLVADRHGRDAILIELNEKYADMAERRIKGDAPLFAEVV